MKCLSLQEYPILSKIPIKISPNKKFLLSCKKSILLLKIMKLTFKTLTIILLAITGLVMELISHSAVINETQNITESLAYTQTAADTLLLAKSRSQTGLLQLLSFALIAFGVYMVRKAIKRTNQIKCPKCKTWFKKGEPVKEDFLGSEIVKKRKKDTEYIRIDGGEKHKIEHEYYVNETQLNYRSYYNCTKCKQLVYINHH